MYLTLGWHGPGKVSVLRSRAEFRSTLEQLDDSQQSWLPSLSRLRPRHSLLSSQERRMWRGTVFHVMPPKLTIMVAPIGRVGTWPLLFKV